MINYDKETKTFHLQTKNTSYAMCIFRDGYLSHLYWGRKLKNITSSELLVLRERSSFCSNPQANDNTFSLDTLPQEYPSYGNTDFRSPAYEIQLDNGSTLTDLRYKSHIIIDGKPSLIGLPSTYVENNNEAQTLEITMEDSLVGLNLILSYSVYKDLDVITRNVRFINRGNTKLKLLRALSMSIDFNHNNYKFMHLHGSWARERNIEIRPLFTGNQSIESRRGSSSHNQNPFIALLSNDADENHGDVYGFNLVYSGNFLAQAEVDQFNTTRVSMGINSFDFSWLLEPEEVFQTPEVVMIYSSDGLGSMSRTYHKLYRERLCRGKFRYEVRPILINNWEATYFNFTEEKILELAENAKDLGIELLVLDDGWFGKRNNDDSSLGDWTVDYKKLPRGLDNLANNINSLGLDFGLWFEPEMISPDSNLYRAHPDWCLHVPSRIPSQARKQLILDLTREDVCNYIIESVSNILRATNIKFVKWDMNRNMTDIGSLSLSPERQRETAHRYMLGLYKILDTITTAFPYILFESCSGGGGRFDPGMLYYMPQTWTSDNTDAVERLKIQYGTSIVYPISSMGSHVSASPNHQIQRSTPLKTRGDVAMSGNFGYQMDLTKLSTKDRAEISNQIQTYKNFRKLIQFGEMYRLLSPFEGNETAWMIISPDKTEALVCYFRVLTLPNPSIVRLYLRGLDKDKYYNISDKNITLGGDELMYAGITIPELKGDYQSLIWHLKSI